AFRPGSLGCGCYRLSDPRAVCLGLSSHLLATLDIPCDQTEGSFATMAMGILAGVHWCSRHRLTGGCPCHSAIYCHWGALSPSGFDPVSHLCGDPDNLGWPGVDATVGDRLARALPSRTQRT